MKSQQTLKAQLNAFNLVNAGIHKNANFMNDVMKAIQNNNVKQFNKLTGKNVNSVNSAKGFLRLYNAYINSQIKIKAKQQKQQITAKKTTQKPPKKSTKKSTKSKPKTMNIFQLHPFKSIFHDDILSFTLYNQYQIQNSAKNIQKMYDFANNLYFKIQNYNTQNRKKIMFVRISVRYKATDNSTRYFSTKKSTITQIENEMKNLLDSLLTYNPNWYNISPTNQEFIDDLADNTYRIYAFDEIKITYYRK